ncbi:MAG: peroxide stress protein YaaA [Capnocytophaga sp.]|nr:MAG: peroxide stress protein YaaA [Capnocytophaga sp.]
MKIVISPAKRMDSHSPYPPITATQAIFQAEILEVYQVLKELTPATLSKLMDISPRLADVSWQYHQAIELPFTMENARPAIYAYHGDVYEGLDVSSLSQEEVLRLQGSLRILSGLYGLLRPLDLIAPYRLEMGIKLAVGGQANLYDFWRKKITQALNNELEEGETLVNLASEEYFKAVDTQALKAKVLHVAFKSWRGDTLKTIVLYTKRARGLMARYIAQHQITKVEDLKGFHLGGYQYAEELSSENEMVFVNG